MVCAPCACVSGEWSTHRFSDESPLHCVPPPPHIRRSECSGWWQEVFARFPCRSHAVKQSCSTLTLQSAAAADRAGVAAAAHQHGGCASLESMHPITAIVMHRDIQHEDAARSSASSHEALHRTEVGL